MSIRTISFKRYDGNQVILVPPSLGELMEANHSVRLVNSVNDSLSLDKIEKNYKGEGTSSYRPLTLLKVLVYSYICNEKCIKCKGQNFYSKFESI